jgi:hypothetical protein
MFTCEETNAIVISGLFTLFLGGTVAWWILFRMDSKKQLEPLDPEQCVEIPNMWISFQKHAHALLCEPLPNWCIQEQLTHNDILLHMYDWMQQHGHTNYVDFHNVLDVLSNTTDHHQCWEAQKWLHLACLLWSMEPEAEMVYWCEPSFEETSSER